MCSNPQLDWDTVGRRAGGPRKYNRTRQLRAEQRLLRVVEPLSERGFCHGYQTRIAEALNVSRPAICRDMAKLLRRHWGGKEAEERHDTQEAMKRRWRREDDLERERLAWEATEPEATGSRSAARLLKHGWHRLHQRREPPNHWPQLLN